MQQQRRGGPAPRIVTRAYGDHPDQIADLALPGGSPPPAGWPVVVLIHGGFWRERYRRDLMAPLATTVVARGWAAWNLEYRRVRGAGGWPETLLDAADGLDALEASSAALDLGRVACVGHSAGGHLALWLGGRSRLPAGVPGAAPRILPTALVGLAPVADLRSAHAAGLGDGAACELLGGDPDAVPARWDVADPLRTVGHGVPTLLVHAVDDQDVPFAQSERYVAAAKAADDHVELQVLTQGGHDIVIEPTAACWSDTLDWLARQLASMA